MSTISPRCRKRKRTLLHDDGLNAVAFHLRKCLRQFSCTSGNVCRNINADARAGGLSFDDQSVRQTLTSRDGRSVRPVTGPPTRCGSKIKACVGGSG
jgi:hypothetical protein